MLLSQWLHNPNRASTSSKDCLQDSLLLVLVFQARVPIDATASFFTPSSHISLVFLLFLSWCEFFFCRALRKYANLKYLGKRVTNENYVHEQAVRAHRPGRPVRFAAHRQPLCWNSCTMHELFCL